MKYGKIVRSIVTKPGTGLIKNSNFGSYHLLWQSDLGQSPLGTLAKGSAKFRSKSSFSDQDRPTLCAWQSFPRRLLVFHLGGTVRDVISNKNSSFLTQTIAHGTKNWIYCTLRPFKEYAKYGIGFDFTFDAHQRCRQIYNLFVYSFDLRKGEDKYVTTLNSSFMLVKDEVKCLNALLFL